jgi:hypothetical protein
MYGEIGRRKTKQKFVLFLHRWHIKKFGQNQKRDLSDDKKAQKASTPIYPKHVVYMSSLSHPEIPKTKKHKN